MDNFMNKILSKCEQYLTKFIDKHWVALLVAVGIIVFVFLLALILSLTTGDFVRAKKACKLKLKGNEEASNKKLAKVRGASVFTFDSMVYAPYGYSRLKALKQIVLLTTIFASLIGGMLSVTIDGLFTTSGAINVFITATIGFLLVLVSAIIARTGYKKASVLFFEVAKQRGVSNNNSSNPSLGNLENNEEELLQSTVALWEKINEASVRRNTSAEELQSLFGLLKEESTKPQSVANKEKLKEARNILLALIEGF